MPVPAELLDCLKELSKNPLTRLSFEKEQQLVALGLIHRWTGFVAITEAGRAALAQAAGEDDAQS